MSKPRIFFVVTLLVLAFAFAAFFLFKHFSGDHSSDLAAHTVEEETSTSTQAKSANPCQENIIMLQAAVDRFKSEKGTYPAKITELVDKYVKEIPKCPGGNGYSIDKDGKVFEDSNYRLEETKAQAASKEDENVRTFTKEELAKYNGKNGQPCYVALNGVVYDLTNIKGWKKGSHGHGILGGKDWTATFNKVAPKSHRSPDFLKKLPAVGKYIGEPSTEVLDIKPH